MGDVQGGTTKEGIHMGVMSGTLDLLQRGYVGSSVSGDVLRFEPRLIDRLVLMHFPVILGTGKSIFNGAQGASAFKLVDHFVSKTGVVFATYEPNGDVPTGSFATKEPSAEELKRQQAMKEGRW